VARKIGVKGGQRTHHDHLFAAEAYKIHWKGTAIQLTKTHQNTDSIEHSSHQHQHPHQQTNQTRTSASTTMHSTTQQFTAVSITFITPVNGPKYKVNTSASYQWINHLVA